jgi:phage shock protein A
MTQLDRKDLKIQALLEKTMQYENQILELRVELTILSEEKNELERSFTELQKEIENNESPKKDKAPTK